MTASTATLAAPRIDSHLHVWDLAAGEYPWLTSQHGELYRTYTPAEAERELQAAGIDAAVLVQAEDSLRETDVLLAVAAKHPWVAGVVGWLPLDAPMAAERALHERRTPALRGVRHLVHNDPRDDFLALPGVRRSLSAVAGAGLAFDVPDAWPRHLASAGDLAAALPELTVVIDHLAKPPVDRSEYEAWRRQLTSVAARPNTVGKVSGLGSAGAPMTTDSVAETWEIALDVFGPSRLMYGGDWPMTVPAGGYLATWHVLSTLIATLSSREQAMVLAGSAAAAYRLERYDGNRGLMKSISATLPKLSEGERQC